MAIHIADNSQYYPRYNQAPMMEMKAVSADMGNAQPLDIDFEKIKVETTVNVKFALAN
jgi:hypothetical protein